MDSALFRIPHVHFSKHVLPMDHSMVLEALKSDFSDFEDALQYDTAQRNQCECIITRNIAGYKKAKIDIQTPEEFFRLLG